MIPGLTALATYAVATLPVPHAVADPLQGLLADPDAEFTFLLVAHPQPLEGLDSDFPYAMATEPLAALSEEEEAADHTVYLSDRGFQTGPADDPPNLNFPPRLLSPYNFEASIPVPGADEGARTSFGALRIANGDREFDYLLGYDWRGRTLTVLVGGTLDRGLATERTLRFAEFGTLFRGTVETIQADDAAITLQLRDPMARLERPALPEVYEGTGGLEGGADIKGLLKPRAYGPNTNVPAVTLDAATGLYQVAAHSIQAIGAIRDKGIVLVLTGDYPDLPSLQAATTGAAGSGADIEAGEYATCLALGVIRVGAAPEGEITADLEGDNSGNGYIDTAPAIARRVSVDLGGLADPDELDAAAFAGLNAPQAVGIWLGPNDSRTVAELLRTIMASVEGWATFTRAGLLTVGLHTAPELETATETLGESRDAARSLTIAQTTDPVWRARVGYQPLALVQPADQLAAGVSAADRTLYGQEYRWATYADSSVEGLYALARPAEKPTLLFDAADAAALAQTIVERDGTIRRTWRMDVTRGFLRYRPGQVVRLDLPLYGLDGGKAVRIVRLSEDAASRTVQAEMWG